VLPKFRATVLFLYALVCLALVAAAPGDVDDSGGSASFSVLSVKDGLVNSSVSGIVQDSKGFIWMGTQGGLVRYDGSSFKTWQNEPFRKDSLSTDLIQTIFLDKGDILWAGTYNGLDRFDPATGRFTVYRNNPDRRDSLSDNLVIAIDRDARGRLWVGTANGLDRLDESTGTFVRYFNRPGDPRSIPHNTVRAIHCDRKGRLWVGTSAGGFALYEPASDDFTVLAGSPEKGRGPREGRAGPPDSLSLQAIAEDADGSLWLGEWGTGLVHYDPESGRSVLYRLPDERIYVVNTGEPEAVRVGTWGGGLFVLDKASGSIESFRHSRAVGSLPYDVVYSMLEDASGELWIGTNGGGVARMDRSQNAYTTLRSDPDDPGSLPDGKVLAILVDSRKDLWVSVYDGGINRYDRATGEWRHFRHDPADPTGLADDTSNSLYEDREGNLWACSNSGLCLFDRARQRFGKVAHFGGVDSRDADIVYAMIEDRTRSDVYWIGSYTKGLYRWDRGAGTWTRWAHDPKNPQSLSDNLVYALAWDPDGRLWVGTNNGLDRFENGRFAQYYYDPANRKGLSSSTITDFFVDSRRLLWIATRSGGLDRYETGDGIFSHFTRNEGLPGNDVYNVVEDAKGDIWIVTQTGLAQWDRSTGAVKAVTLDKSLEDMAYNQGACADADGKLYFGSIGSVTVFDPERYRSNTHVPPVYVTDFTAANRPKLAEPESKGPVIHLHSWENSIEIRFAALDFRDPSQNLFAWKLDGFDKDWNYSSTRRFATYTNLGGGRYVFRVKAANNDGIWNEAGAAMPFTVDDPPWRSPAAFALYLLLIALVGYGLATLRSNRLLAAKVRELTQARGELEKATADARRLAAQAEEATRAKTDFVAMVSHEVRNSLNGIIGVAELLSRGRLEERQSDEVSVIRQSGNLLLSLVNDILDLSKMETDRVDLENLPWSPSELAARLRSLHQDGAAERGIALKVDVSPLLPDFVGGDPTRIQQIVENLLSNALRFTERGEVRVAFEQEKEAEDERAKLRISVADTGTGISPEKMSTIFEPFRQADPTISRRFGGTGLGLSIVKRLVGLMAGDISVQSEPGVGSTFTILIPLLPAPPFGGTDEEPREGSASGLRVLVVDDDPVNRRVAVELVGWLGGKAGEAESGEAALEAVSGGEWDVALLDERMPAMDGPETARRIREAEKARGARRVALYSMTARLEGDIRRRCAEAGMDGFLAKPITLESLGAVLARLPVAPRPEPEPESEPPQVPETPAIEPTRAAGGAVPSSSPVFNIAYFEDRYTDDDSLGMEILELWLSNTAVLFQKALVAGRFGDVQSLRSHLHRLGGSTSIVTDGPVVDGIKSLERELIAAERKGLDPGDMLSKLEALGPSFETLVAGIRDYLAGLVAKKRSD